MEQKKSGKMNWKAVLAVVIILAIVGFFFVTQIGTQFTSQLGLGSLTSFLVKQKPSSVFAFSLTAQKDAFIGQDYKVTNASLDITGIYSFISAGNLNLESTQGKRISISVRDFNGDFQISAGGSVILKGTASSADIGDLSASSGNSINIQLEILPSSYTFSSFQQNSINFASISGSIQRGVGDSTDVVNLSNSKLTIEYFTGSLSMQDDGTTTLLGSASSIKGDTFSFV